MNCKTLDIDKAEAYTLKWQTENKNKHCSAFLIPATDLICSLTEMGIIKDGVVDENNLDTAGVRAYMAIDSSIKEGYGEKLVLVGTVDVGGVHRDIVEGEKGGYAAALGITMDGSGAFDFTSPCPNDCDDDSPLNHNV